MLYGVENNYVTYCCYYGDRRELNSMKIYYPFVHWSLVEKSGIK